MVKAKLRIILIVLLAAIIAISMVLAIGAISASCSNKKNVAEAYTTTTPKVAYYGEYLGTVQRNVPNEMSNGGLAEYPKYGSTLRSVIGDSADKVSARKALIDESWSLCSVNTRIGTDGYPKNTYNSMDKDGNLLLNGTPTGKKLYKHTASVGMYLGDVADSEPGIVKKLTFSPRSYSRYYNVTGVYAPAGEVIKIQLSEEDMNATNGIVIHIGQALYNAKANNIWVQKNAMNRMPVILNTMVVDKNTATLENGVWTAYVGSYFGGPIYVPHEGVTYSVTISGGVRYSHYIYGYTTEKEYEQNDKSSAPYFDLEVWDNGVLHSGPKNYVKNFSFEDLTKAAELWDKIALVSTKVSKQGIVFIYDPFVAAGAAVAFPGQGSVNCPADWMSGSLNYKSFVNSGSWGNMHEYNHNFQGFGRGDGGEVTNNALNVVEYSLFTKISSNRKIGASGDGLSGWNRYTSPSWSLNQTLLNAVEGRNPEYPLNEYSTVLHNFGQQMFMDAVVRQRSGKYGENYSGWFRALSETTHNDFTYFFSDILKVDLNPETADNIHNKNYPVFIPAASIYQTGRSFIYNEYEKVLDENGNETEEDSAKVKTRNKMYCETAKPYVIPYGTAFTVDLSPYTVNESGQYESGSIVLPQGFSYKIKKVTSPEHGKMKKGKNNVYTFIPSKSHLLSGKIYVTLQITKDGEKTKFDDIELVLEFEQTHEMTKSMLERTTYTFSSAKYTDAVEAYNNKYSGATEKIESDNKNPTQNSNTDVWYSADEPAPDNSVVEVRGKLYVTESGKYRIALRGRWNCALYVAIVKAGTKSTDVKDSDYKLAATITKETYWGNASFPAADKLVAGTYKDFDNLEAGQWIYFKEVMICAKEGKTSSFIGLGVGRFENMGGTIGEDQSGADVDFIEKPPKINYASAYRSTYEFPDGEFTTEYFYEHDYKVNYLKTYNELTEKSIVEVKNFTPSNDTFVIENLIDDDTTNYIHSKDKVSADNPFDLTVDLGKTISANRVVMYGYKIGKKHTPTSFEFYVGKKLNKLELVGKFVNGAINGHDAAFNFEDGGREFRYYRLVVTETATKEYVALREIEFSDSAQNGNLLGPKDDMFKYKGNWTYESCLSTFGQTAVGDKKAKMEFVFTGTRVAIFSQFLPEYGKVTVVVDGKKKVLDLSKGEGEVKLAYISKNLKQGRHKVVIKCKGKINFNVAAVGIWK